MINNISTVTGIAEASVWAFSLIFFRIGAAMAFLPAFGEQVVPMRIKLAATISFSSIITPFVWDNFASSELTKNWLTLIGPEVVSGLLVGFAFRCMVFALQIAGTIAAQSTSLSQSFGGGLGVDPQPALSTLLVVSGLCLAVMLGLHIRVIELFLSSYTIFPIGHWPGTGIAAEWGIETISYIFGLGFSLAGPFIISSMIYNFGLGAINKAMPQLMVAFVGAPAISFGGLTLLFLASPLILRVWGRALEIRVNFDGAGF